MFRRFFPDRGESDSLLKKRQKCKKMVKKGIFIEKNLKKYGFSAVKDLTERLVKCIVNTLRNCAAVSNIIESAGE